MKALGGAALSMRKTRPRRTASQLRTGRAKSVWPRRQSVAAPASRTPSPTEPRPPERGEKSHPEQLRASLQGQLGSAACQVGRPDAASPRGTLPARARRRRSTGICQTALCLSSALCRAPEQLLGPPAAAAQPWKMAAVQGSFGQYAQGQAAAPSLSSAHALYRQRRYGEALEHCHSVSRRWPRRHVLTRSPPPERRAPSAPPQCPDSAPPALAARRSSPRSPAELTPCC